MSSNNENLAIQRIAKLVDENSFMEIGSLVTARSTDFNLTAAKTPSDCRRSVHDRLQRHLKGSLQR